MSVFRETRVIETLPGQWELVTSKGWLPGVYDSPSTARRASWLPLDVLERLAQVAERERRAVTADEIAEYEPWSHERPARSSDRGRLRQRLPGHRAET